ncbi:MASE1 domain-containing protein [Stenotrophomonas sp.]|uniref:MASE1 domain-containing protein n=1 Tax=Stenotrophomonas sp. TaxID=69392 RepID=UPI0028A68704|nr:MASE1 domain-containing protein [Stenotrophomonas sp.]
MQMDWWTNGVGVNFRLRPVGLALAVLYAAAYWASREVSFDQFYLPAGVRVAALLLCPPRLWPYLLLGEYCYFAWLRYPLVVKYGATWAVLGSAFLMPAVMLIVHLHRKVLEDKADIWLICIAASSTVSTTALNVGLSFLLWPSPPAHGFGVNLIRFLVGDFIGILTLAPLALLWVNRRRDSTKTLDSTAPTIICFALMFVLGGTTLWLPGPSSSQTDLLLLMALPAVALTCIHGWRGAAISIPLWSIVARLNMPASGMADAFDPVSFSIQQSIAVVGIALLAVGSCLSYYYRQHRAHAQNGERATSLARSAHIANEMDLRSRALDIRKLGDGLDHSLSDLADWLKIKGHDDLATSLLRVVTVHSRKFREQVTMVYPTSLEHVGLYLALQIGGIHEAWKSTDRLALHRLGGDPCQLSVGLQLATYRSIAEAVSLLLQYEPGQIQVRARCGTFQREKGILVSVALLDSHHRLSATSMTQAIERLTGRTLGYNGTVQCRRNRIRMVLLEPADDEAWMQPSISRGAA